MAPPAQLADTAADLNTLKAEATAAFIREGFMPRDQFRMGIEVESFCRTRWGSRPVYRGGANAMERVLATLARRLWGIAEYENGDIIGVKSLWGNLSLEPGCQLEWSSHPYGNLSELLRAARRWQEFRDDALARHDLRISQRSFDDQDVPLGAWPPKARYDKMRRRYYGIGERAWAPMQRTAGIHLSYDFANDEDWRRKFRGMLMAAPMAVSLFANSRAPWRGQSFAAVRPLIWTAFDPERTRLPEFCFGKDLNIDRWADWAARRPPLLPDAEAATPYDASSRLGEIFTAVRSQRRLEVRINDRVRDDLLAGLVGFWTAVVYDDRCLEGLLEDTSTIATRSEWEELLVDACQNGYAVAEPLHELRCRTLRRVFDALDRGRFSDRGCLEARNSLDRRLRQLTSPDPRRRLDSMSA